MPGFLGMPPPEGDYEFNAKRGWIVVILALVLVVMFVLFAPRAEAQTAEDPFADPFWTIEKYTTIYCDYRGSYLDFLDSQYVVGAWDREDAALEAYLRDDFDIMIRILGASVIGERPPSDTFICS